MAPVKFDDLHKVAKDVLDDDFKVSGYEFKAKQKTSWESSVVTTAVDVLNPKSSLSSAKITWKMPKLLGVAGFNVDKLEIDKSGKFKFEASTDKDLHNVPDLKAELKSDLSSLDATKVGVTYTAIKDVQLKAETAVLKPEKLTFEATGTFQGVTAGVRCTPGTLHTPDLGARYQHGSLFGAVTISKLNLGSPLGSLTAFGQCKINNDAKVAVSYTGKGVINAALAYSIAPGMAVKVKGDVSASELQTSLKYDLAKGFTVLAGGKFSQKGIISYGCSVSIE